MAVGELLEDFVVGHQFLANDGGRLVQGDTLLRCLAGCAIGAGAAREGGSNPAATEI